MQVSELLEQLRQKRDELDAQIKLIERAAGVSGTQRLIASVKAPPQAQASAKPGRKPQGKKCTVPGCGRPHQAKGFCATHYQSWKRKQKDAQS